MSTDELLAQLDRTREQDWKAMLARSTGKEE